MSRADPEGGTILARRAPSGRLARLLRACSLPDRRRMAPLWRPAALRVVQVGFEGDAATGELRGASTL